MPPQLLATCGSPEGVEPKARPEGVARAPPSFLLGASVADGASAGDAGSGASAGGGASAGDAGGGGGRSRARRSGRARQRAKARATAGHGGKGKGKVAQPGHGGITSEASITSSAASPPALDGGITSSAASPALDGGGGGRSRARASGRTRQRWKRWHARQAALDDGGKGKGKVAKAGHGCNCCFCLWRTTNATAHFCHDCCFCRHWSEFRLLSTVDGSRPSFLG